MRLMHGDNGSNPSRFDDLPVGRWTEMREDAHGLYVTGQLVGVKYKEIGRRLYALMSSPGGQAEHALTLNPDHPIGANHRFHEP